MGTLVLAAVNAKKSLNLDLAQKICFAGNFDLLDLNDFKEIPILSSELLERNFPKEVCLLFDKLSQYKNLIIVTPEHNGYYSAFFKNILDWLSRYRPKYFDNQNVVLVVATPGQKGGLGLRTYADVTLRFSGASSVKNFGFKEYNENKDCQSEIQEVIDYIADLNL